MEYEYEVKVPKARVAVLIGKDGITKKEIEESLKIKLDIDSTEGDVRIRGKDAVALMDAKEIIRAIGRGFNPEIALLLTRADYHFELIDISEFCKTKKSIARMKGRVIGSEGKSRRTIEDLTETNIVVFGKTIGIIGEIEMVALAKRAIEMLLRGSNHSTVYSFLERQRRELKRRRIIGEEEV